MSVQLMDVCICCISSAGILNPLIIKVLYMENDIGSHLGLFDELLSHSSSILFVRKAEDSWPVELVSDNISMIGYDADDFLSGKVVFADIVHPDDLMRVLMEVKSNTRNGLDNIINTDSWDEDNISVLSTVSHLFSNFIENDIKEGQIAKNAQKLSEINVGLHGGQYMGRKQII